MFSSLPTKVLHFVQIVNNVGMNQIQHGPSNIDRPDLPKFNNLAFLYRYVKILDITNYSNQMIAKDIFTHIMDDHIMDENRYCQDLKYERLTPNSVIVIVTNILNDTDLPRIGILTAEQAQGFMPIKDDQSLTNPRHLIIQLKIHN